MSPKIKTRARPPAARRHAALSRRQRPWVRPEEREGHRLGKKQHCPRGQRPQGCLLNL